MRGQRESVGGGGKPMSLHRGNIALLVIALIFSAQVHAEKPLWELGAGLVAFHQPQYPGAEQARNLILPFPYFIYRGKKVRAENGRVRGLLLSTDKLAIDISLGGALPVSSEDNRLRERMPDLDPMLEIGPSLKWHFSERLNVELPLRWANSIDGTNIDERGWISTPQLRYMREGEATRLQMTLGAVYASRQLQNYFYAVDPEYVTGDRPRYLADPGLMAYRATINYQKRFGNTIIGAYAAYYDLSDAENLASPLLAEESQFSVGLRIAWILRTAKKRVNVKQR